MLLESMNITLKAYKKNKIIFANRNSLLINGTHKIHTIIMHLNISVFL